MNRMGGELLTLVIFRDFLALFLEIECQIEKKRNWSLYAYIIKYTL